MQQLVLVIHVFVAIGLVAMVLIQQGKGADIGAAFGSGASNTMFGSAGAAGFMIKVTGALAAVFFLTSLTLSYLATSDIKDSAEIPAQVIEQQSIPAPASAPAQPMSSVPAVPSSTE